MKVSWSTGNLGGSPEAAEGVLKKETAATAGGVCFKKSRRFITHLESPRARDLSIYSMARNGTLGPCCFGLL